jgi:hypothetical protein
MTQPEVLSLLIQVPILGAFIWFTLRLSSDFRADAKIRDTQWQDFIKQENILWRGFVQELVEKSTVADDMVSQRLFELVGIIKDLQGDFKVHDLATARARAGTPRGNNSD